MDCTTPENYLSKACCATPPCDLSSLFPLPSFKSIPGPPSQTNDTGLLDTTDRLCFYQVDEPTPGNTVRVTENSADADMIDIFY